ncbi:uncharacterized protein SPSK_08202 [Sporothrix schenckii 1099-18]|uniref:Uncharacterized protein n=1 Tax=Sporothrix schenckii 1099-18 TaxID=1397361 RepID=A0A0F2ME69_SPOSC|nr:uncharacterized protein SPSK_08202 [Sporothrix schenckii 1099-18]KJR87963.1 hypothetical protein SPSK_08202 [Sporothrix schenckii 1099-18]
MASIAKHHQKAARHSFRRQTWGNGFFCRRVRASLDPCPVEFLLGVEPMPRLQFDLERNANAREERSHRDNELEEESETLNRA